MQQVAPLLDHFVGADDAVSAHHSSRWERPDDRQRL